MAEERREGTVPAYVVGVSTFVVVVVVGIVLTDGGFSVGVALCWLICGGLLALVVTRHLRIAGVVDEGPGLAVAYDALPILLLMAWGFSVFLTIEQIECVAIEHNFQYDKQDTKARGSVSV